MREDEDGLWDELSFLWVEFPITGHWGTVEELWSRHELEDLLDAPAAPAADAGN